VGDTARPQLRPIGPTAVNLIAQHVIRAVICLVGAVLAEQHDEWTEARRYLGLDVLARARLTTATDSTTSTVEEVPTHDIPALSA
jgi:hypothetical protein